MKILYVSQYFPPEMGAPAARVHELSREWVKLGHQVTVLTGFPNHPTGVVPQEYRGQWTRVDHVDGIKVVRVPIYVAANKGRLRRAANYASFSVSAGTIGQILTDRPDVVIATSPQFLVGLSGFLLSRTKRVPLVFEVRDLWPRSIVEVGALDAGSPVIKVLERLEKFMYRTATHVVAVTDSFVPEIVAHGADPSRDSVVTNGVDLELFKPGDRVAARQSLGFSPDEFLATYVGTHGMAHGLDVLLEAAAALPENGFRVLLVGEGAEKENLKRKAAEMGLANVTFWDQQPRTVVSKVLDASDVCLVLLKDKPLFKTVIPSKIFEFMGAGRPILTTVDGESRVIVEKAGAGVFVPAGDPRALADALRGLRTRREFLDKAGASGRAYVEGNYSRPALAKWYLDVLSSKVLT